jgi:hypothetical protein
MYSDFWRKNPCQRTRIRLQKVLRRFDIGSDDSRFAGFSVARADVSLENCPMSQPEPPSARETESGDDWWDYCPICNAKLINQKCKYVCSNAKCNFFMSCSEFDL